MRHHPWAHDPEVCPSPDCPGCYAEAYVPRNVTSLSEDCPHCGSPLRPRCLCWQSGDDENPVEDVEDGHPLSSGSSFYTGDGA